MENEPKELILIDLAVMLNDGVLEHKLFYEPVKLKPAIVAEKGCLYMDNDEKYSLDGYSEHQRENWANSDITIYEEETQLRSFIRQAINSPKKDNNAFRKMYFGMIPESLADRIKNETGTEINVKGYNIAISNHEIRKIFKDHGNEKTEMLRGQRAITEDDIVNIPQIFQNPGKVILDNRTYFGRPVIKFIKTINGRTTIVSYVSNKNQDLAVQTMYSGKRSGALATAITEQASINTPKATSGTGSTIDNIEN